MPDVVRPRRSPKPAERKRDAERTRARIVDAAVEELSAKGIAGVRVSAIADRAGVNKQLISYYFGGKDGLLRAIGDRWRSQKSEYDDSERPYSEVIADYTRAALANPTFTRLLGWEGLTYISGQDPDLEERTAQARHDLADMRQRKDRGEIAADIDPACVFLVFVAACTAPVLLPQMARGIFGDAVDSPEFAEHYTEQMAIIARHLAG